MLTNTEAINRGVPVKTNSYGLRDIEHSLEKPEGSYRILFYGDSYTFGQRLSMEETFNKKLEQKLNLVLPDSVETINFGVCGMNTFQEMMYFIQRGLIFNPDMVVVVWISNDVDLNGYKYSDIEYFKEHKTVSRKAIKDSTEKVMGHAVIEGSDKTVQTTGLRKKNSKMIYLKIQSVVYNLYTARVFGARARNLAYKIFGLNMSVWEEEYFDLNRTGFQLSLASIKYFDEICRENRIEFVVAIFPNMQLLKTEHYNDLAYRKVEGFCRENRIRCLNMFNSFRGLDYRKMRSSLIDAHPNDRATDVASDALHEFILPIARQASESDTILSSPIKM